MLLVYIICRFQQPYQVFTSKEICLFIDVGIHKGIKKRYLVIFEEHSHTSELSIVSKTDGHLIFEVGTTSLIEGTFVSRQQYVLYFLFSNVGTKNAVKKRLSCEFRRLSTQVGIRYGIETRWSHDFRSSQVTTSDLNLLCLDKIFHKNNVQCRE